MFLDFFCFLTESKDHKKMPIIIIEKSKTLLTDEKNFFNVPKYFQKKKMISIKKFNSQKFSLIPLKKGNSFQRASSLKNPEQMLTLRDLMVEKLEKCLIIDQLNSKKPFNSPPPERKPNNFIIKTKTPLPKITRSEQKIATIAEIPESGEKIKIQPEKKKKKKPKKKPKISNPEKEMPKKLLDEPIISYGNLVIKQKGLND